MRITYRYPLSPTDNQRSVMDSHRDICRQLYNHGLYRFEQIPESSGTLKQRVRSVRDEIPDLKKWWTALTDVYSTVLQTAVMRIANNIKALGRLKEEGFKVGSLNWKRPRDFRSFTYTQSDFKLDKKSGQTVLHLSKIGDVPIQIHREIPDEATIKQVHLKKEPTGEWFASFSVEEDRELPKKPETPETVVGIDVGILKYAHDTDGTTVESLNLSDERERLEREQRKLSRKDHGSNNYEKQRRRVAECHADLKQKRRDFLHKLSNYYAKKYNLVAVEDLNIAGMMQFDSNSRNRASAAWRTFLRLLEYKCEREGTHYVPVDPRNTTKECAACGVKTHKPLWVREHSCPSCGFTADRDWNAAYNILVRGLKKADIGAGCSESTPVETALPTGTAVVPAKRVIEAGSPVLSEAVRPSRAG